MGERESEGDSVGSDPLSHGEGVRGEVQSPEPGQSARSMTHRQTGSE